MMLWKKNRSINTSAGSLVPGANQGKTSNIEEVFHEGGGGFTRLLIIAGVFLVLGLNIGNTHRNIMEEENTFKLNIFELEEDNSMRKICPSANNLLVDNMNSIKSAHGKAEEFHNKGGNLKVLEKFLNANIDNTYRNTGAKFVPDGKDEPLSDKESIKDYIANAKRVNDKRLRGGYGDRSNYGTFQSLPNHISHRKDEAVIDVKESLSNWERWKTGMGPIAVDLCKNVTNIISGIEKKMICSLDNSFVKSSVEKQEKELSSGIDVVNTKDAGKENKCSIMSIGSNGQWGFEKYIVESSSCETHTFDCTVKDPRKPRNDNVHFYPYCISHENKVEGGKEYLTYSQMMDKAGLEDSPQIFKMDVEGFEYDVLTQMLREASEPGSKNNLPAQISIELHYGTRMYDLAWLKRWRNAGEIALFSGMMYNLGGYLPVKLEEQETCDACMEVLYVRVFCD